MRMEKISAIAERDFLAAGQEGHVLGPLAGDADVDIDARFQEVVLVRQQEFGAAAGKQAREDLLEAAVDAFEGFRKPFPGDGVDPGDRRLERLDGGVQIGHLGGQEFIAGVQFFVLVQGQEVDLAEGLDRLPVFFQSSRRVPPWPLRQVG